MVVKRLATCATIVKVRPERFYGGELRLATVYGLHRSRCPGFSLYASSNESKVGTNESLYYTRQVNCMQLDNCGGSFLVNALTAGEGSDRTLFCVSRRFAQTPENVATVCFSTVWPNAGERSDRTLFAKYS